jgi:hypothetical protein
MHGSRKNLTFLPRCVAWRVAIACLFAIGASNSARSAEPAYVRAFVTKHCVACHGEEKHEADLRLDTLATDLATSENAETWNTVLERVAAGEMPPDDRPRPGPQEQKRVLDWVQKQLIAAQTKGLIAAPKRGPRRLNRLEYENSVNTLLGIKLDLAGMLPEDGSAAGFDRVGSALNISPVQIEKYLEAADAALDEALTEREKVPSKTERFTLKDCKTAYVQFVRHDHYAASKDGDADLLWFATDKWVPIEPFAAPARGHYHVRISAYSTLIGENARRPDTPVLMGIHAGKFRTGGRGAHLVDIYSMPWEEPTVFEFTEYLEPEQTFKVMIANSQSRAKPVSEFTGPALAWQWIEITGPLDDGSAERRSELLFGSVDPAQRTQADADQLLQRFATRAFRRPATKKDIAPYRAVMQQQFEHGASFQQALRIGMQTVLCSPEFLFVDRRPERDDYDTASRLAYFLWSSPPDDELLDLAASGRLSEPDVRRQQVERMLADPRAATFTRDFLDHWLDLAKMDFTIPDRGLYPSFDEPLLDAMAKETRLFFDELLTHDLSVTNFIDSDFAMLNERLATHYGIEGVKGGEFRKVTLPEDSVRGGVMTQASVLKVTADGTITSPILRGVWLLERIIGSPVPPPPPGVPALEPDTRGATTVREQLAQHRRSDVCASCHKKIDPAGFALENFDPIGAWRDNYKLLLTEKDETSGETTVRPKLGPKVEAADVLPDGRAFQSVKEFKRHLLSDPNDIATVVVEKLLTYALGREPDAGDRAEIARIVKDSKKKDYGLRTIVKEVVASELFMD